LSGFAVVTCTSPLLRDEEESSGKSNQSNLISLLGLPDRSDSRIGDQVNPFLGVPSGSATEFRKGYVIRKCCYDPGGKRTAKGKRGWRTFFATLRDLVLYLHKDDRGFRKNQLYESLKNSIRIHHSFASKASDYEKKDFVFRLQTADQAEYLFKVR
jgi:PH/SEC7 domain-containing protein